MNVSANMSGEAVAVIGLGCWYPGANSPTALWENILTRRQQFRRFPDSRLPLADYHDPDAAAPDKTYGTRAAVIDGFVFDWAKRRIPKSVVESTDIVHWLALEVALQALQDAGYGETALPSARTGVLVGNTLTGEHTRAQALRQRWPYIRRALNEAMSPLLPPAQARQIGARMEQYFKSPFKTATEDTLAGGLSNTIAGRICNFLNLHGGGYTVDGACASSLIAVANAANLVASGELDMAFAGGVDVSLDTFEMIGFAKTGALTPGEMTVYDKRGSGFIPGEGCGFVLLKRFDRALADGDKIYAVLRGWGISSDGKGGLTAPRAEGQALALERAYRRAGYGVQDLDFIEGHGTGTTVGDRVELQGMALAASKFGAIAPRSVGVTSFKSLVGHTKAAAGVGGFIKAVLAVNARVVPPTVKCDQPHAVFDNEALGFYPVTQGSVRESALPMRAGVSGSGFGGINCHVTLESGPSVRPVLPDGSDEARLMAGAQDSEVFLLSSGSPDGLMQACRALKDRCHGMATGEMADLAAECAQKPVKGKFRLALIAVSPTDLAEKLDLAATHLTRTPDLTGPAELPGDVLLGEASRTPRVGFLYPGQGSQQINMARRLVERHAWARDKVSAADKVLEHHGFPPVSPVMFRSLERAFGTPVEAEWRAALTDTRQAQVALCLASLLHTEFLKRLGVTPALVAGHSLGELSALCISGALSEDQLILLAAERGHAMAEPADGQAGAMAMVACGEEQARRIADAVPGYLVVACVNSPRQTVLSGDADAVDAGVAHAESTGIKARRLAVSNAFHSRLIAKAASRLSGLDWLSESASLDTPFVSALDGSVVETKIALRRYCAEQVLAPVRFADVAATVARRCDIAIEVGPARALSGFVADCAVDDLRCLPVEAQPGADRDLNRVVAQLFVRGAPIDPAELHADRLIRPFIPASERLFIDNPCERPFPVPEPADAPAQVMELAEAPAGWIGQLADGLGAIPSARMSQYLARRGRFLERVVLADMDHDGLALPEEAQTQMPPPVPIQADEDMPSPPAPGAGETGALDLLLEEVAAKTGFDAGSLDAGLRLLDDLNLDSIKSAELIADTAARLGITGALDPAQFANATIGEAASALDAARPTATDPDPADGPRPEAKADAQPGRVCTYGQRLVASPLTTGPRTLSGAITILATEAASAADLAAHLAAPNRELCSAAFADATGLDHTVTHLVILLDEGSAAEAALQISATQRLPASDGSLTYILRGTVPGAAAFAASLHLERPGLQVRVIECPSGAQTDWLAGTLEAELSDDAAFAHAIYDGANRRQTRQWHIETTEAYARRNLSWNDSDVILVTGGAKGITAECALALAESCAARFALTGSSAHGDDAPNPEVAVTLARYRDLGLTARYYACDIADKAAVAAMLQQVSSDLGPVTGVLHGAGINRPRRAETVSLEEAASEIAPKMNGARNLIDLLEDAPLKAFVALTSIIGVTGMAGNAWYAYSNQAVDALVENLGATRPDCAAFTVAYSVWDEVGMGARMGSTTHLARMGITAIPPAQGIERFLALWRGEAGPGVKVVAARLGGLDTWFVEDRGAALDLRFVEEVRSIHPGVELIARAHLDPDRDVYLRDHDYKGSLLFPTVFGMEAMAQAAARLLGTLDDFAPGRVVVFEDIQLTRPIVVSEGKGADIELHAELEQGEGPRSIRVGIRTGQTGWNIDHFVARIVLGSDDIGAEAEPAPPGAPLAIDPTQDLYGPLLFQGPRFQRLTKVHALDEEREFEGQGLMSLAGADDATNLADSFASGGGTLLLGDAFARDAVLQSGQLLMPRHLCLPIAIARATVACGEHVGALHLRTQLHGREDRDVTATCTLRDASGQVVHHLEGYRVRILEEKPEHPAVADLAALGAWETRRLAETLALAFSATGTAPVDLRLFPCPGLHDQSRDARHALERGMVEDMWRDLRDDDMPALSWQADGKPVFDAAAGLSISHDDRSCLVALGDGALGCDLAPVSPRSRADWLALLGDAQAALLDRLCAAGDDPDCAATRIWATREALVKAGHADADLQVASHVEGAVVLKSGDLLVLSIVLRDWGVPRVIAVTVEPGEAVRSELHGEAGAATWTSRDEAGALRFHHRFNLMMDDVASVSRAVQASRYFAWMGKVRELALQPVMAPLAAAVGSGDWGAVTNSSDVRIHGEAHGSDRIIGTVQAIRLPDSNDATIDLQFDWARELPSGGTEVIASSLMRTSWVRVTGHGLVEKHPLPDFLQDFLARIGERQADSVALPGHGIAGLSPGQTEVSHEGRFGAQPLLCRETFDTDQEDSNLVGNIYHSNYAKWCGRVLDRFLHRAAPDHFRQAGRAGEWLTQSSRLTYLRDAMPFDRIEVEMRLAALSAHGAKLVFLFYRRDCDAGRTKLAQGESQVIWTVRRPDGQPAAAEVPAPWRAAFLNGAGDPGARSDSNETRDQVYQ